MMLKGTVALNYMNTNVVYVFFFQTQIQFCTIYSSSYKKKFPTYKIHMKQAEFPVELFPKGYKG